MTRRNRIAALPAALVLAALACSCSRGAKSSATGAESTLALDGAPARPAPRADVAYVPLPRPRGRVALALGTDPGVDSLVLAPGPRSGSSRWMIQRASGSGGPPRTLDATAAFLDSAGSVALHGDGTREAFFVTSDGGTGLTNRELNLYCPRADRLLTLTMTFMHDDTRPVPEIVRSDELERPDFAAEAAFLEDVKRDFGYLSDADLAARPDDPRWAFYFWRIDNEGLADGASMRVRRFKGRQVGQGTVNDTLSWGGITYSACFKSGVVAYDAAADEHWVVFHPTDPYTWPTRLAAAGDVLVIGTRGEGLALVKLPSLALRRLHLLGNDDVEQLAIEDGTIVVNGSARVPVPAF